MKGKKDCVDLEIEGIHLLFSPEQEPVDTPEIEVGVMNSHKRTDHQGELDIEMFEVIDQEVEE